MLFRIIIFSMHLWLLAAYAGIPPCHGQQRDDSPVEEASFDFWVQQLGDPSPAARNRAKYQLQLGREAANAALQNGLRASDLQIRTSARQLLVQLAEQRVERQLSRLLVESSDKIDLPGWTKFQQLAGDTSASRRLFAALTRDYGESLEWLQGLDQDALEPLENRLLDMDRFLPLDMERLNDGDAVRWGLMLLAGSHKSLVSTPVLSSRLRSGLLSIQVIQRLNASPHRDVLRTMVASWLSVSSEQYVNSSMLRIAVMYDCEEVALDLARQSLSNQQSSPAGIATSLMLLARLRPEMAKSELRRWTDDNRVCHIWQIVTTRRRAVQTQIGDVAIALLIHLEQRDPRDFGFVDLEADPDTIFREFSMGFEDDGSRQRAYTEAHALLGVHEPAIMPSQP